jgi:phosphatidylethanolamine-binding protein (PEBP) family uncharacterized protein
MGSRESFMKNCFSVTALAAALVLAGVPAVDGQQTLTMGHATELVVKMLPPTTQDRLSVTSPSFKEGADIPYEYTQYQGNVFPGLDWTGGPAGTHSYAVIVQGESLSRSGAATSIHLTIFNLPALRRSAYPLSSQKRVSLPSVRPRHPIAAAAGR